jgi:uncharacterized protein (TIGR02147 family)
MNGKRKLTSKNIESFIKGLGLNESDARYFAALVQFNQSSSPIEKQQLLAQIRGFKRKVQQAAVPIDTYDYYSEWYHIVIREQVCITDWKGDYKLLARSLSPSIATEQARDSVKFLLSKGFIRKCDDGHWEQCDPAITSGSEVASLGVRTFNRLMASRAVKAIDEFSPVERDMQSLVVGISDDGYKLIKQEIQEFMGRVIRIVDDDKKADRVYNINMHLFPVSSRRGDGEENGDAS